MPIANADLVERPASPEIPTELPFPPVTKSHILNCSYHSWYPKYRSLTPKARLISLSQPFLSYLRADGIRLPPGDHAPTDSWDNDPSDGEEDTEENIDPSREWQDIHQKIKDTIAELKGSVMPKLNWSAPKDATWIAATNSMECNTANDIYLLLKSSDFVTHDLEQVFDDCEDDSESESENQSGSEEGSEDNTLSKIPYHLILRKTVPNFNPALEFRCFVRSRHLLCICQRDLNHFSFLPPLIPKLCSLIQEFFEKNLQKSFPDESFAFDVYIPEPYKRVWLIDVNPWAPRTDPLLFSWLEILNMRGAEHGNVVPEVEEGVVRLYLNDDGSLDHGAREHGAISSGQNGHNRSIHWDGLLDEDPGSEDEHEEDEEEDDDIFTPEFRLVNRDDPEAYSFNTPQYSAHKLPKDVVDASADGEVGLREFMATWREIVARREREEKEEDDGDGAED
ncbi:hypothetical protein ABVK25_004522 [Lepraria finkii]|uniref:Cell division cycle protein 123 homolog n=1 Tax=Lepraria finkii TaxID=1340010 RepID=A0ABR4BBF4_9LECA